MPSIVWRPSKCFLFIEDLLEIFCTSRTTFSTPKMFYVSMTFQRNSIYPGPSRGLLYIDDLSDMFYTSMTLERYSIFRRPSRGLLNFLFLNTEDLPWVFYTRERPSRDLLYNEDPPDIFYIPKTLHRSSKFRRPYRGLLYWEELHRSSMHRRGLVFPRELQDDIPEIFYTPKIF